MTDQKEKRWVMVNGDFAITWEEKLAIEFSEPCKICQHRDIFHTMHDGDVECVIDGCPCAYQLS